MVVAMIQLVPCETFVAGNALEVEDAGKKLPKEVFPRDLLGSQTDHKFIQLEVSVCNMRRLHLAVCVHENLSLLAHLPLPLCVCE